MCLCRVFMGRKRGMSGVLLFRVSLSPAINLRQSCFRYLSRNVNLKGFFFIAFVAFCQKKKCNRVSVGEIRHLLYL